MSTILSAGTVSSGATLSSDTAGTLQIQTGSTPTTAITVDASQNVGVGATPTNNTLGKTLQVGQAGALVAESGTNRWWLGNNWYYNGGDKYINAGYATLYSQQNGTHQWFNAPSGSANGGISFTQAMTLDASGNLLFATRSGAGNAGQLVMGTTQTPGSNSYLIVTASAAEPYPIGVKGTSSSQGMMAFFDSSNATVGSITKSGSSVAYNTSSDYRLKEDVKPMTGALNTVAQLKPVTYKWKADGYDGQGFIAHELQAVVPECVTGEKDAVDAEGKPIYQGIDTSFLVATLTAAIQELKAEIDELKAKVA